MLSNSCRYGIRAVIYIASHSPEKGMIGIKQISRDLELPTPFLAKILQQLTKQKFLISSKGPHGGFSLLSDPALISLFDIVVAIDGEELFTNCIIHDGTCKSVESDKKDCPVHDDFAKYRSGLIDLFKSKTISDLVSKANSSEKISI